MSRASITTPTFLWTPGGRRRCWYHQHVDGHDYLYVADVFTYEEHLREVWMLPNNWIVV